ncbi:hypothetical protein GWK47_006130 [Chionoecetes opilio]|uniref:Uncharacterized protein n=1 Tax=Chionoecetes opilio TaxID=41210 RepID=A0A8J4YFV0_CHIOP|nr:hypothetical protein GWK47_006130 [Chionoecetes opilio]
MEHKTGKLGQSFKPPSKHTSPLLTHPSPLTKRRPPLQMPFTPPHPRASRSHLPLPQSPSEIWFYNDRVRELNSRINSTRRHYRRKPTAQNRALLQAVVSAATGGKLTFGWEHWLNWCRGLDSHSSLGEMWRQLQVIAGNKRPIRPPHPDPDHCSRRQRGRLLICHSHLH